MVAYWLSLSFTAVFLVSGFFVSMPHQHRNIGVCQDVFRHPAEQQIVPGAVNECPHDEQIGIEFMCFGEKLCAEDVFADGQLMSRHSHAMFRQHIRNFGRSLAFAAPHQNMDLMPPEEDSGAPRGPRAA